MRHRNGRLRGFVFEREFLTRGERDRRACRPGWMIESLERRVLCSGTIPAVPTPAAHWAFDDGSGTAAVDSSGNGHTGTLGAGVTWSAGNVGTHAISLNGSSTAVVTATGPVVNTAASFTASAWVNLASVSGYQTVVSIEGTNVAGFYLGLRSDTDAFSFARIASDTTAAATVIAAPNAPVAGTWYHIVGVDDVTAGTLTLYVDGQSMGSVAYTGGWAATGNTLIGHGFYGGAQVDYVDGSIDDVELFSSALSAAQVAALDQPAYYPFDEGTGTTASDYSGHGHPLTLGSGASWAAGYVGSNSLAVNGTATGNATYASPVVNTSQSFSVSAWVNLNALSGYQTFVSIDGTNISAFFLQYRGDTGKFAFTRLASDSTSATTYTAGATSAPVAGTWYNLIGVDNVAAGQLQLYVNGVLQSTVTDASSWQASGATVVGGGKFSGSRTDFVSGDIDDVHFFDSPLSASAAAFVGMGGNSTINITTTSTGVTVSPDLFGAFMEDINYGGEGGVYNDEVRNSGFNDATNPLNSWAAVAGTGVNDSLVSDTTTGPTTALTQSGKLTITSGVSSTARAGISNAGYFGVAVAPSTSYTVDFYAKATTGFAGPLIVDLESTTGTVFATATINSITSSWADYTATLTTGTNTPTTSTNLFVISTNSTTANGATVWFGATYLYPPSYDNATNHLRIDLLQKLAALKPAIFRVPGGNYLEGNTYADRFNWSTTVGPIQDRPGHYNSAWGYWSTDGLGLDEYLQMADEVGAQPVLAVYAGYTLNGSSDTGTTLTNDVTDAVNELHYVLDPVTTAWGAERAANGHPAPYDVSMVEIGNEDFFSSTYATRYPLFYSAIHAAFPSLQIIATSTSTGGSPYDILDEHFYESPQWFEANSDYFDDVTRGSSKVFIGEYASQQGSPTPDMESALGDSSWLLGLERNSDLVTMSSYAPLWVNVNSYQWGTNLIGFNNTTSYGSPSYYAQLILANNHGTTVVSDSVSGATGLQTIVTRTGSTYYLTVINTVGTANTTTVNLAGVTGVSATGTTTSLTGASSNATNSITNPTNIVPVTSTETGLGTTFTQTFAGYSITILQFTADNAPTVATAAAANPATAVTTTSLSVLGADSAGESNLTYTWAATGPAAVTFNINGTNAAKNAIATFTQPGSYTFTVTIANSLGQTTTSSVGVTVVPTVYSGAVGADTYAIRLSPTNSQIEQIFVNTPETSTPTYTVALTQLPSLTFTPTGGDGSLTVDFSNGNPLPSGGVTYTGGANPTATGNALFVDGVATGLLSFSINGSQVTNTAAGSSPISYSSLKRIEFDLSGSSNLLTQMAQPSAPVTFNAGSGANTLNISGGTFTFNTDPQIGSGNLAVNDNAAVVFAAPASGSGINLRHLAALNIGAGATATLATATAHADRTLLIDGSLTISSTGRLNLGGNDADISAGNLATVIGEIRTGYNNGNWQGNGIVSSQAAASTTHLTVVGVLLNNDGAGHAIYGSGTTLGTFDGTSPGATDILLKYTYYGDANLDGTVDGSDYTKIDNGFNTHASGWQNGDFNYDGVIDGSDYTLIDNAFNTHGASLAAQIASPAARVSKAVKDDSTLSMSPADFHRLSPVIGKLVSGEPVFANVPIAAPHDAATLNLASSLPTFLQMKLHAKKPIEKSTEWSAMSDQAE